MRNSYPHNLLLFIHLTNIYWAPSHQCLELVQNKTGKVPTGTYLEGWGETENKKVCEQADKCLSLRKQPGGCHSAPPPGAARTCSPSPPPNPEALIQSYDYLSYNYPVSSLISKHQTFICYQGPGVKRLTLDSSLNSFWKQAFWFFLIPKAPVGERGPTSSDIRVSSAAPHLVRNLQTAVCPFANCKAFRIAVWAQIKKSA